MVGEEEELARQVGEEEESILELVVEGGRLRAQICLQGELIKQRLRAGAGYRLESGLEEAGQCDGEELEDVSEEELEALQRDSEMLEMENRGLSELVKELRGDVRSLVGRLEEEGDTGVEGETMTEVGDGLEINDNIPVVSGELSRLSSEIATGDMEPFDSRLEGTARYACFTSSSC